MKKSNNIKIETVSISDLKPYPQNNKIHTEDQIKKIAKSIDEFGFLQPLVIDKDNTIVVGHARFEALKFLKRDEVEVVRIEGLSDEKIRLYRILDNKLSDDSQFDINALKLEFEDLKALDLFLDFELDEWDLKQSLVSIETVDLPKIEDVDNPDHTKVTFTLHNEQFEILNNALKKAKKNSLPNDLNDNENGNALTYICEVFNES